MNKYYDLNIMNDGENSISMIEITQEQYDQYREEAEENAVPIDSYIIDCIMYEKELNHSSTIDEEE